MTDSKQISQHVQNDVCDAYTAKLPTVKDTDGQTLGDEERIKELEAKDVLPNINCMQTAKRAKKCHFLSPVTLIFYLDLQTHPSEGPNMSFV